MAAKYASTTARGLAAAGEEAGDVGWLPRCTPGTSASAATTAPASNSTSAPAASTLPSRRRRRGGRARSDRHPSGVVVLGTRVRWAQGQRARVRWAQEQRAQVPGAQGRRARVGEMAARAESWYRPPA